MTLTGALFFPIAPFTSTGEPAPYVPAELGSLIEHGRSPVRAR